MPLLSTEKANTLEVILSASTSLVSTLVAFSLHSIDVSVILLELPVVRLLFLVESVLVLLREVDRALLLEPLTCFEGEHGIKDVLNTFSVQSQ